MQEKQAIRKVGLTMFCLIFRKSTNRANDFYVHFQIIISISLNLWTHNPGTGGFFFGAYGVI